MNDSSGRDDHNRSYRLIRPLGEMFHCEVYLAEWSGVEGFVKQLTIWHVRPELCVDPQSVEVLLDGLKSAAALSASTASQILDVWWQDSRIAVSAEHVSGLSMGAAMGMAADKDELLPIDVVLKALLDVVHALEQAHDPETRAGTVYHGDLRPDSVLFGYEGAVKVTGFGFASFLPMISDDGAWCTWNGRCYQPPERFFGTQATPETDVYALGAILLEAATGIIPYGSGNPAEIIRRLRAGESALPRDRSGIQPDLAEVIARACARDPRDRYPSMTELAADLYRLQIERRRAASGPPTRLRDLLRTLESPSERRAKAESAQMQSMPSHKSQVLKAPRLAQVSNSPPVTLPQRPLVGRTEVLRLISQALAGTNAGRGQAVLLTGADGMGKTRLLTEVAIRLSSSRRKLAWVQVQCRPQDQSQRYSAVLRLLASSIGLAPETPIEQLAAQADRLRAFGLEESTLAAVRGLLGQGIPPEPAHLAGLMAQAIIQVLSSLSWEQTTIVAWDDAQWADQASMVCLGELLEQLQTIPVVVFATGPRGFTLPWAPRTIRAIELGPLSTRECKGLVLQRMEPAERVDPALMAALLERSGGNPSLLEELIELLVESSRLELDGQTVRLRAGTAHEVPDLQQGVRARFDTLDPDAATVAVIAALAGPALVPEVIARATGLSDHRVERALEELVNRRVLRSRRQGLSFPHEQLRQATLGAAGVESLNAYRAAVAQAALEVGGGKVRGWRAHAAQLFSEAGDLDRAADVLVEAAKLKESRGDLAGAAQQYSSALEMAEQDELFGPKEALRLCLKTGNAALHSLQLELGQRALRRAQSLAEELGNTGAGARARVMLCRLLAREGRLREAMDIVQEAIPLAEESGDPLILCQVYNAIAESYQQWGEYGPDFEYIEPALRLASESGDLLQLGRSLQLAVNHAAGIGKYQRTEELLKRARAIAHTSGDPLLTCQLIRAESLVNIFSGELEEGLERTLQGLELAHKNGLQELEVIFLHNAGDAHLRCGRMHEALYYFNESLRRSTAARFDRLTEGNDMYIGYLEATFLQAPGGWERLSAATETARQTGRIWNVTQGHQLMGRTLLAQGDIQGALGHFEESLRLAEASGVAFFVEEASSWLEEARRYDAN